MSDQQSPPTLLPPPDPECGWCQGEESGLPCVCNAVAVTLFHEDVPECVMRPARDPRWIAVASTADLEAVGTVERGRRQAEGSALKKLQEMVKAEMRDE